MRDKTLWEQGKGVDKLEVRFYSDASAAQIDFAVIGAQYQGKWIFCKHRGRDTFEIPGGHVEPGETAAQAAARELREETGAVEFTLHPICVYSVTGKTRVNQSGGESFGLLCFAEVAALEALHSEIERIEFFDDLPAELTYPAIQPFLHEKICQFRLQAQFARDDTGKKQ